MSGEQTQVKRPAALIVVQAFPPLLRNAGGVAKRYLALCNALIDGLGWQVTLVTPVNVARCGDPNVERWIRDGTLNPVPARGVKVHTMDGTAVFLDLFSTWNAGWLLHILQEHPWRYKVCIIDDVPWRIHLCMLMRAFNVTTIVTSHTDAPRLEQAKDPAFKVVWYMHMLSARYADVHATVSRVFGNILEKRENTPVTAVWPPILWAKVFRDDNSVHEKAAKQTRAEWEAALGFKPRAILLFAGRWSTEKRIDLLFDAVPDGSALVIVGDGSSEYSDFIGNIKVKHVLPVRRMHNANELRIAYQACDLFVSASNFETLGNTVVEALCCGAPVAVQPAQGHLEFVKDGVNSYFVDYDKPVEARAKLERIVSEGLTADALPELKSIGDYFRNTDFPNEFKAGVLDQALAIGLKRTKVRKRDMIFRVFMFIVWGLLFWVMRAVTRITFRFSKFPKFEVLGQLGSSIEEDTVYHRKDGEISLHVSPRNQQNGKLD